MYLIYPYDGVENGNSHQYFTQNCEKLKDELNLNVLFFDIQQCRFIQNTHTENKQYRLYQDIFLSSN